MNAEVEKLFHELADLSAEERDRYFTEHSVEGDTRREVEQLLAFDADATALLERDVEIAVKRALPQLEAHDYRCGPFRLVKAIGRGGMGAVFLADRVDGEVTQQAAIKFLGFTHDVRSFRERFLQERQIMATLNHQGIARLLDAGHTADGQPYLAMEYVDGVPIDVFAEGLDVRAKLALFLRVCDAVSYAHRNLVVHRDLKPSNILVTRSGEPKLMDFGIAKILDAAHQTTQTVERMLTPEYASPEQIRGGAQNTATDVYSVGAILYKLLTGSSPHARWADTREGLMAAISNVEPELPSRVRNVPRDLDFVVSKALRKEPEERYQSAEALAEDVWAFLESRPVRARSGDAWYRVRKFARRYWIPVTAAAIVIGSLATGLLLANHERKVAEQRFAQVRQLAGKFIALDDAIRGLPGSTKIRMRIVSDSLQYLTSLGGDVRGDTDLALETAFAYVRVAHAQGDPTSPNLGQFAEAQVSLDHAARLVDSVLARDPLNKRGLFIATTIAHDRMMLADSRHNMAEQLKYADRTASLIEQFMSTRPVESHDLYSMRYFYVNIAYTYYQARRFNDVLRYCQRGLDIRLPGQDASLRGAILSVLGSGRWQSGDLDGALKTTTEAIELEKAEAASGHAALRINLADGYELGGMILGRQDAEPSLGRSRDALAYFQKALDIAEDLAQKDASDYLGRHHVAIASLEIGNILRRRNPKDALAVYEHALARIREARSNASTQRDEAGLLAASSYPLRWTGRNKEAQQRIARAFELLTQTGLYPNDSVEPMSDNYDVLRAQADDYAQTGETNKAIQAYQQLLHKLMAWKLDPQRDLRDAVCILRTWTALANLLRRTGRNDEATRLEAQRSDLRKHWTGRLPNAEFLLRQSPSQIGLHFDLPNSHVLSAYKRGAS
jgi:tetratricopeptide (TPR) repeat protein/predicted Ser/Thr protein kinase